MADGGKLLQILILIPKIIPRVAQDGFLIRRLELAAKFSRGAHPERFGFDDGFLRDQRTGRDDRSRANACPVQDGGAHADQAAVFDNASVQRNRVADGDIFSDVDAVLLLHAVQNRTILHVGMGPNPDLMYVTAQDSVHPHAGVFAEPDVADDLCRQVDVAGCRNRWMLSLEGTNHARLSTIGFYIESRSY